MEAVIIGQNDEVLKVIDLEPKIFKSGNMAFFGKSEMPMDGKCCQGDMILVQIRSKSK